MKVEDRRKGHSLGERGGGESKRAAERESAACLFYGVKLRRTILSPRQSGRVLFLRSLHTLLRHLPPLCIRHPFTCRSYSSPQTVFRERHKFSPEKYGAMTRELSFARFSSSPAPPAAREVRHENLYHAG